MELKYPWVLYAALGLIAFALMLGIIIGLARHRRERAGEGVAVARAERIRSLPAFKTAINKRMLGLASVLTLGIIALMLAGVVAARPQSLKTVDQVASHRDIVLCLDVSGSMIWTNEQVLKTFVDLAKEFEGERLGLTIWNSNAVQVFPLTSDYEFIEEQLTKAYQGDHYEETAGTYLPTSTGSSLIGDGLASCVLSFDHPDKDRSRSIILSTDNQLAGDPIVSLQEAADMASEKDVRVFAVTPDALHWQESQEMGLAAQSTGGAIYELTNSQTVTQIAADVRKEAVAELRGKPQTVSTDVPGPWIVALLLATGAFIIVLERVKP